jgi:hypothetical protein
VQPQVAGRDRRSLRRRGIWKRRAGSSTLAPHAWTGDVPRPSKMVAILGLASQRSCLAGLLASLQVGVGAVTLVVAVTRVGAKSLPGCDSSTACDRIVPTAINRSRDNQA